MTLRAMALVARLCALTIVLAALQSFAYVTPVPRWLQIAVAVVPGLLVLWRPLDGLQWLAAFVPIAVATGQQFGSPALPFAEAMALSAIAGAFARSLRGRRALRCFSPSSRGTRSRAGATTWLVVTI